MSHAQEINIRKLVINTRIITTVEELDNGLYDLLLISRHEGVKSIVGLDIEKDYNHTESRNKFTTQVTENITTLMVCSGKLCLIIRLSSMIGSNAFCVVSKFLQLRELTFVGIRIQYCISALEKQYGLKCRNSFELSQFRLKLKDHRKVTSFEGYTLVDLAVEATNIQQFLDTKKSRSICNADALCEWGIDELSKEQIEGVTWRSFLCFYTGNYFCDGLVTAHSFWEHGKTGSFFRISDMCHIN